MRLAWLWMAALGAACGGNVKVDGDTGGGGAGAGGESSAPPSKNNPNDVLAVCNRFCERFEKELGCTDPACVGNCTTQYENAGVCAPLVADLLECAADELTACEVPPPCQEEYDAFEDCDDDT